MDMEPTTIKVIVPTSKYLGQIMQVEMIYDDDLYAKAADGHVFRYHKSHVEVVHVRDWDNFLYVDGHITSSVWRVIQVFAHGLPDCVLVGGGWTGLEGHMTIKFKIGTAAQNLPALAEFVQQYGLTASKPTPTLF